MWEATRKRKETKEDAKMVAKKVRRMDGIVKKKRAAVLWHCLHVKGDDDGSQLHG
jgi:hypothetical protein